MGYLSGVLDYMAYLCSCIYSRILDVWSLKCKKEWWEQDYVCCEIMFCDLDSICDVLFCRTNFTHVRYFDCLALFKKSLQNIAGIKIIFSRFGRDIAIAQAQNCIIIK